MRKTLVINMLAGPGAGKTACAWEIASELKKRGYVTEYVSEYAKELVWDNNLTLLDGSIEHQLALLNEQERRIRRLIGQVDFVVTDSPLLLSAVYAKGTEQERKAFEDVVMEKYSQYDNFNAFIKRGSTYEQEGRIHSLDESRRLDKEILGLLKEHDLFCGEYTYQNIKYIVPNCIRTHERIGRKKPQPEVGIEI